MVWQYDNLVLNVLKIIGNGWIFRFRLDLECKSGKILANTLEQYLTVLQGCPL